MFWSLDAPSRAWIPKNPIHEENKRPIEGHFFPCGDAHYRCRLRLRAANQRPLLLFRFHWSDVSHVGCCCGRAHRADSVHASCLFINREWCRWGDFMLPTAGVLSSCHMTHNRGSCMHVLTQGVQIWLLYIQIIHGAAMSGLVSLTVGLFLSVYFH